MWTPYLEIISILFFPSPHNCLLKTVWEFSDYGQSTSWWAEKKIVWLFYKSHSQSRWESCTFNKLLNCCYYIFSLRSVLITSRKVLASPIDQFNTLNKCHFTNHGNASCVHDLFPDMIYLLSHSRPVQPSQILDAQPKYFLVTVFSYTASGATSV